MSSQVIEVAAVVPATSFHTVREKRYCERLLALQISSWCLQHVLTFTRINVTFVFTNTRLKLEVPLDRRCYCGRLVLIPWVFHQSDSCP